MIHKFVEKILKLWHEVADSIAFKGLNIRVRFTLFFFRTLFWLLVIVSIGVTLMLTNASYRSTLEDLMIHDKVGQNIIRKLRGASISAHKIVILDDISIVNQHAQRGRERLDNVTAFIQALLKGGLVKDYSEAIEHLFGEIMVKPVGDEEGRRILKEAQEKVQALSRAFDTLVTVRVDELSPYRDRKGGTAHQKVLEGLSDVDTRTMETVILMGDFSSATEKLIRENKERINNFQHISIIAFILSFLTATSLLLIFLIRLSRSLTAPIKSMTERIKEMSGGGIMISGESTLSKEKDELKELFHQFEDLVMWFTKMNSFKKVIEEDYTVEEVYYRLADAIRKNIGLTNFVIYEISNSKNTMRVVYPVGAEAYCDKETQLNCTLCRSGRTGHIVSSMEYHDICKHFLHSKEKEYICVPMIMGGATGGILQIVFNKNEEGFNPDVINKELSLAQQYIDVALPVIEAKRLQATLKESSLRDTLTGLHNRRFLEEYTTTIVSGVLRKQSLLGLLMCDLDFFKEVNDVYGHDVGDMVLRETANVIKGNIRSSDIVVRFGGEEFLVVLMDSREGEAEKVAEKIRAQMESMKIRIPGGFIQKTISIGISEFPKDTEQFWEAIKFSDVALYKAKETGRNRVVRFLPEMWPLEGY